MAWNWQSKVLQLLKIQAAPQLSMQSPASGPDGVLLFVLKTLPGQSHLSLPFNIHLSFPLEVRLHTACACNPSDCRPFQSLWKFLNEVLKRLSTSNLSDYQCGFHKRHFTGNLPFLWSSSLAASVKLLLLP